MTTDTKAQHTDETREPFIWKGAQCKGRERNSIPQFHHEDPDVTQRNME